MNYSKPPKPSRASRSMALKSRGSCRGFAIFQNRVIVFESHLELMVFFMLTLRMQTATVEDQPDAVTYWDGETLRRHTFDFLVINHDGSRIYIAVKPAKRVERSGVKTTLRLIADQLPPGSPSVRLITDADFSYADRYNATQAFDFLRFPVEEHDEAIAAMADDLVGAVRIADLVAASGLGAMGFRAIVRLIAHRVFEPVNRKERITNDTLVRPVVA
ncbi:hypothetical protein AB8A20_12095 [Tardiphaga sp. 604_B6_N1_1]|uniref:hypothetical protein n=1 Tax=Tardiphaga sp. 604_B6_N1_1 TaxID=3240779 RepID=UPI003F24FC64